MNEQIKATTDDLLDRLGLVTAKQDDLMDQQQEMDATLKRVEDNVEQVGTDAHNISCSLCLDRHFSTASAIPSWSAASSAGYVLLSLLHFRSGGTLHVVDEIRGKGDVTSSY